MKIMRTPDDRFDSIPDYPFAPHYLDIPFEGEVLRMHYLDEGSGSSGETVLLMHGQPSWSFLYRHVIPGLVAAGHRVVAPDLIGYGKSDKPADLSDYTYERQVTWTRAALFEQLALRDVTLFCHDWGGLIALRIVAHEPELFRRVMISNTGLPWGDKDSFFTPTNPLKRLAGTVGTAMWQRYSRTSKKFAIGAFIQRALTATKLNDDVVRAYDAPFPSNEFKGAARGMPQCIPTRPDSPGTAENREAWGLLGSFTKPFATAWSEKDATLKMMPIDELIQAYVPGASGQPHVRIAGAGHFPQEDNPGAVVSAITEFIAANPN
jgi:haloalkane dehalogenase